MFGFFKRRAEKYDREMFNRGQLHAIDTLMLGERGIEMLQNEVQAAVDFGEFTKFDQGVRHVLWIAYGLRSVHIQRV